ncbi:CIS tube protein [Chitinophaga nivalis]|uniref:Contractile injection system tube protein N-terminal domain-containing protein n=1 Tax=Chitinophaga nivalis TaxID=2991709 RepID=A0ABT3IP38_9BACT|nr:hypothetical protein [Chitinophaga nivalis]MCW3464568.1 hypothetical protein [Chitinophaga nivalis]MCW3485741.1 hypothetical protein [Chitinophaga nivalis]
MAKSKETANVEKIVIRPFLNQKQDKPAGKDFVIPINPESYAQAFKVEAKQKATGGNQGSAPEYKFTNPEQLKLDFTLDNTGTIEGNILDGTPVNEQVTQLLETVYKMKGEAHKPPILKIKWGLYTFDCILANLDISYVLFKPNGEPLRAKVSATFTQYVEPVKRVAKEDKRSPDLTRSIRIADGDTLPLLCYRNYGDPALYTQVAYFNQLTSVRNLHTDDELIFPPLRNTGEQ